MIFSKAADIPIYCTTKGADIIKKQYHKIGISGSQTGDTLNINMAGFVEMTMIHWPDSMMTFVKGPNVCSPMMLSGSTLQEHPYLRTKMMSVCKQEAMKYMGILTPMSALIKKNK